jgi:hypothetical protein
MIMSIHEKTGADWPLRRAHWPAEEERQRLGQLLLQRMLKGASELLLEM